MRTIVFGAAFVILAITTAAPICLHAQQVPQSLRPVSLASAVVPTPAKTAMIIRIDLGRQKLMSNSAAFQQNQLMLVKMPTLANSTKARVIPFPAKMPVQLVASNK